MSTQNNVDKTNQSLPGLNPGQGAISPIKIPLMPKQFRRDCVSEKLDTARAASSWFCQHTKANGLVRKIPNLIYQVDKRTLTNKVVRSLGDIWTTHVQAKLRATGIM